MFRVEGCITALITPFNSKMEVDYEGLARNVKFQLANGVSAISPLGTTGESPTVHDEERSRIISETVSAADGKVPVIVGTGASSTHKTIKYTQEASKLGADAVLISSPYYNRPTQEGIYRHFKAVSESVDIPIIIYNIEKRTGVNIETQTIVRLSKLKNIAGVKESSGSMSQIIDVIDETNKDFIVLSGEDALTLPLIALGGKGVISAVSNLLPRRMSDLARASLDSDFEKARRIHKELMPIFKVAFIETNPIPIKTAMQLCGMPAGPVRLPLCEMDPKKADLLRGVLSKYGELRLK